MVSNPGKSIGSFIRVWRDPPPPSLKYVMEIPAGISYTPGMYHNPLPIFLSGTKTNKEVSFCLLNLFHFVATLYKPFSR